MITPEELELIRIEQEKLMPEEDFIIRRRQYVSAEEVHIPSNVATGVPGRLTPGFGVWRQVADRFQGITAYTGTFPLGTDIRAGDELIDTASQTYQVRDTLIPKSYATAVRVLLDRVSD